MKAKREKSLLQDKISRLEHLVSNANEENTRANALILELQTELRQRRSEAALAQAQLEEAAGRQGETAPAVSATEANKDCTGGDEDREANADDEGLAMVRALQSGIEARRREKAMLRAKVASLQEQLRERILQADEDARSSSETIFKLKSDHATMTDRDRQAWAAEHQALQQRNDKIEEQLQDITAAQNASRQRNEHLESANFQLQQQLAQVNASLADAKAHEVQLKVTQEKLEAEQGNLRNMTLKCERARSREGARDNALPDGEVPSRGRERARDDALSDGEVPSRGDHVMF